MNDTLTPAAGVRVLFTLVSKTERDAVQTATYELTLFYPDEAQKFMLEIPAQGAADLSEVLRRNASDSGLERALRGFSRKLQVSHKSDGAWPRRMLRWREM